MANAEFERRLRLVSVDDWNQPTPCDAWDVRALINHVIGGNRRYAMLLRGASAAEVDATRSTNHLGPDPVASFVGAASELRSVFAEDGAMFRLAHHPAGERTGADLAAMRVLDVAVHAWDLARAVGANERLAPDLVKFALTCTTHIEALRPHGYFAPTVADHALDGSPQDHLLYLAGRDPSHAEDTR